MRIRSPFHWFLAAFWLCLAPAVALAQDPTCPQIVQQALTAADSVCAGAGRNQACYGNVELSAVPRPEVTSFAFSAVGDIANVSDIQQMTLMPMDTASGRWGVALLRLQTNLPDTLPGQNVTFLLFGDVQLTNAVSDGNPDGLRPMQAFYLKTGLRDSQCIEAPESGMLVQTPQGVGEVQFRVNGVDVQMGSTVFFQADVEQGMSVSTLEGAAYVEAEGQQQVIIPGTWVRIPLEVLPDQPLGIFAPAGLPELPESYEGRMPLLEALPLDLLERPIDLAPPLTEDQVQALREQIEDLKRADQRLCGLEPFPPCDQFELPPLGDLACVFPPGPNDPPLPANETRPFCPPPELPNRGPLDDRPCVFPPGPNDPPLPANETRPFCPPPEPPHNDAPPAGDDGEGNGGSSVGGSSDDDGGNG